MPKKKEETPAEPRQVTRLDPILLREFPHLGKYRNRIIKSSLGPRAVTVLDIREYVKGENFEGFTRRGIRIHTLGEVRTLIQILRTVEEEKLLREETAR